MAGTLKLIAAPAYIAATSENIYTPANAAVDTVIKHIRIGNTDVSTAYTYTLWVGATGAEAAGTELSGASESVPAASHVDLFFSPGLRLASTQFLVGKASTGSKLTITVMGEYVAV